MITRIGTVSLLTQGVAKAYHVGQNGVFQFLHIEVDVTRADLFC